MRRNICSYNDVLTWSDLGHIVVLAEFGKIRIQVFDSFFMRLEEFGSRVGLCQFEEL